MAPTFAWKSWCWPTINLTTDFCWSDVCWIAPFCFRNTLSNTLLWLVDPGESLSNSGPKRKPARCSNGKTFNFAS